MTNEEKKEDPHAFYDELLDVYGGEEPVFVREAKDLLRVNALIGKSLLRILDKLEQIRMEMPDRGEPDYGDR